MAITIGVRWELRGKNIWNEEGISKHRNSSSIINKIFSYAINVQKCLFRLLLSLLMPSPAVAHMSWVRLWEVHLLQVQGFCFPLRNPGRNGHCGTKADPEESPCSHQSALPLEVGSTPEQDCQERFPECSRDAPAQSLAAAAFLLCSQVCPSSAQAPAQRCLGCVSCSVTASGTTPASKPQEINDLVSQSFTDSIWPKAAKSYLARSYCKLPRAEQVGSLRNKNAVGISSWVKKWWLQPLTRAC